MGRKEESKVKKQIHVGSTALVRLYDGREVEAKVTAIVNGPGAKGSYRIWSVRVMV
jgi:hypothetical protein